MQIFLCHWCSTGDYFGQWCLELRWTARTNHQGIPMRLWELTMPLGRLWLRATVSTTFSIIEHNLALHACNHLLLIKFFVIFLLFSSYVTSVLICLGFFISLWNDELAFCFAASWNSYSEKLVSAQLSTIISFVLIKHNDGVYLVSKRSIEY
jgi:hypothetical protein